MRSDSDWSVAWQWLQRSRSGAPANADIWDLRFNQHERIPDIIHRAEKGLYRLKPMQLVRLGDGRSCAMWSSADALVLKWVSLQVSGLLPLHKNCYHIRGNGGAGRSVGLVSVALSSGEWSFVYRTDIRGYYASIRKIRVLEHLSHYVSCPVLSGLLYQWLYYSVEDGGVGNASN